MKAEEYLVNGDYLLKKFAGKGGWTYAEIPEIAQNKNNPFGWVKVKGFVDAYELKQYKLMPMGNGKLFLPLKSAVRKLIHKEAGDTVHIMLKPDETRTEIPAEILACFDLESKKLVEIFKSFSEGDRKSYIDWIYDAKTQETKVQRIALMMRRLEKKLKFYDKGS